MGSAPGPIRLGGTTANTATEPLDFRVLFEAIVTWHSCRIFVWSP
jgi:hypothetical protein